MKSKNQKGYRLNQFIAHCGLASRRKAEELISDGVVTVNNQLADHPGLRVDPIRDVVRVRGKRLTAPAISTILLHKPKGVISSREDREGRKTIYDLLPNRLVKGGLQSIGRLDFNSSGLMVLTNDGELHQAMEHPSGGVEREYRVKARGALVAEERGKLLSGVVLEDGPAKAKAVTMGKCSGGISRFHLVLEEGRNREVRRLCEAVGLEVLELKRVRFGPIRLGTLPSGRWREPTLHEKANFEKIKKRGPSSVKRRDKKNRRNRPSGS